MRQGAAASIKASHAGTLDELLYTFLVDAVFGYRNHAGDHREQAGTNSNTVNWARESFGMRSK